MPRRCAHFAILIAGLFGNISGTMGRAQIAPYRLQVETGAGLMAFTFSAGRAQARVYFPDDLASGETFSVTTEGPTGFTFEFAGQTASASAGLIVWRVPNTADGEFAALILRDAKGKEAGRASIPIFAKRISAGRVIMPKNVQAGTPAPIPGPFDGDARATSVTIGGQPALVVAESPRKVLVLCPEATGVVDYSVSANGVRAQGQVRSIVIDTEAAGGVSVHGLQGLDEDIPFTLDGEYLFLRSANVNAEGSYISARSSGEKLRLVFAQTPRDRVALLLRAPRKDLKKNAALEHAEAMRNLDFDALPVLAEFLDDGDLGGDAAYAMLALDGFADQKRALPILFQSMPASGQNIQRIGFNWFLSKAGSPQALASAASAHAAALRVLNEQRTSSTDSVELALLILGFTGGAEDAALLEKNYQYRNGWTGLKRVQDASEAAMARLGSREHAANIRAELAVKVAKDATPTEALAASQSLQKAGFSGLTEFVPAICAHLDDPTVVDIDVAWDSKPSAMSALNAIVNKTSPVAPLQKKTVAEWKEYCAGTR